MSEDRQEAEKGEDILDFFCLDNLLVHHHTFSEGGGCGGHGCCTGAQAALFDIQIKISLPLYDSSPHPPLDSSGEKSNSGIGQVRLYCDSSLKEVRLRGNVRSKIAAAVVPATPEAVIKAARLIRNGGLVAFPTETVYGLGSNASDDAAVLSLFTVKGRPFWNPLIVHVDSIDSATALVDLEERGSVLARENWPGPLTLVARRRSGCAISRLATAELETLAVRVPDHPVALSLLATLGCPIVAPSANLSGFTSPTTAAHVADSLAGAVDLILDGGSCRVGLESTVIDLSGPHATLLRPGGVTIEKIERLIGPLAPACSRTESVTRSPGMLHRHYAPSRPLRLNAHDVRPGEVLLGFGRVPGATLNLSQQADVEEAAANLFHMLRALDRRDVTVIAVSPVPSIGLGVAINDRLRRAAAGKDEPVG